MAGLTAKAGQVTLTTGVGSQDVTLSFTPKCVIVWGTLQTANDTNESTGRWHFGISDGTRDRGRAFAVSHGVATPQEEERLETAFSLVGTTDASAAAVDFQGTIVMAANKFTLTWSDQPAAAYLVNYLALGGTALNAYAGFVAEPTAATDPWTVEDAGFAPTLMLASHFQSRTTAGATTTDDAMAHLGAASGATEERGTGVRIRNSASDVGRGKSGAVLVDVIIGGGSTNLPIINFSSFTSAGFTAAVTTPETGGSSLIYLLLGGIDAQVGSFNQPASATTNKITTDFEPAALLLFGSSRADGTYSTLHHYHGIGAITSDSEEVTAFVTWDDSVNTNVWRRISASAGFYHATIAAGSSAPTAEGAAQLDPTNNFEADGATLTWSDGDATTRPVSYIALGPPETAAAEEIPFLVQARRI